MKFAIKANLSRGKEIISLLESLGGINSRDLVGDGDDGAYYIDENNIIRYNYKSMDYKVYTLEEFEKEFPFKIGDRVIYDYASNFVGTVVDIKFDDNIPYRVDINGTICTCGTIMLKPYKEMKEERNITLTLDKAKEWYKKGGELREIALQAFTEKELNPLPRSWEEFCRNNPVQVGECWLENCDEICKKELSKNEARVYKNWIPSRKSAEAHLAMIQLEQLRDCWRQGWIPSKRDGGFGIRFDFYGGFRIIRLYSFSAFLSFPTEEMAEEFLECFRDLIEKAGDLI